MATLATILNSFTGVRAADATSRPGVRDEACRLRALPNEDIYLFVKRHDNTRVMRRADPHARALDWKVAGSIAVLFLTGAMLTLPKAYGMVAGYRIDVLEKEEKRLLNERARLTGLEAEMLSAARLHEIAEQQRMIDPAPESVHYLPGSDEALALNRR